MSRMESGTSDWRYHLEVAHARVRGEVYRNYLAEPKVPVPDSWQLQNVTRPLRGSDMPQHMECVASAIEESGVLSSTLLGNSLDASLQLVDRALEFRERAIEGYRASAAAGESSLPLWQARLGKAYANVYKGIISRNVTDVMRLEAAQELKTIGEEMAGLFHVAPDRQELLAFGFKISVAMAAMMGPGNICMLPATPRARQPSSHDRNHHDFLLLRGTDIQNLLPIFVVTPFSRCTIMPDPQVVFTLDGPPQADSAVADLEALFDPGRTVADITPRMTYLHGRLRALAA